MDLTNDQDNDIVGNPGLATPTKKATAKRGKSSRKSPSGNNQSKSCSDVKIKKPKLPLYSTTNTKSKGRTVTWGQHLESLKLMEDSVVSKKDEPSLKKSHATIFEDYVRQLIPSSRLKATSAEAKHSGLDHDPHLAGAENLLFFKSRSDNTPESTPSSTQDEDSENVVPFKSQLLFIDDQPTSSQDSSEQRSQDKPGKSNEGNQYMFPSELEADAAPSILDVSDFPTCNKGQHNLTLTGSVSSFRRNASPVNLNSNANSHDGAPLEGQSELLFTELFRQPRLETGMESSGRQVQKDLAQHPPSGTRTSDVMQSEHSSVQVSASALPSLKCDMFDMRPVPKGCATYEPHGKQVFVTPSAKLSDDSDNMNDQRTEMGFTTSENLKERTVPALPLSSPWKHPGCKSGDNGGGSVMSPGASFPTAEVVQTGIAAQNLFTSSSLPGNDLPLFTTAGRRKMVTPKAASLGRVLALAEEVGLLDLPVVSNPPKNIPGASTSKIASSVEHSPDATDSKLLNTQTVDSGKNTPKNTWKKPRYDSFLEDDAELFERLETPSEHEQIDEKMSCKTCNGVRGGKEVSRSSSNEDEIDCENLPRSPVLSIVDNLNGHKVDLMDNRPMFDDLNKGRDRMSPEVIQEEQESLNVEFNNENWPQSPVISPSIDDVAGNNVKPRESLISIPAPPSSGGLLLSPFKSAGGKNIVLREANLAKARTMFDSVTKGCDQMPPEVIQDKEDDVNYEFDDENRPKSPVINLSVDGMAGNIVTPHKSTISTPTPPSSGGLLLSPFKSAGGKNIVLSDANLAKARTMFDSVTKGCDQMPPEVIQDKEDDVNCEFNDENRPKSPVINLSVDGMAGNIVTPDKSTISTPTPPSSGGLLLSPFKSAGGKNIVLSDANLAKARTMFDSVTKGCDQMPPEVTEEEQDNINFEFNDENRYRHPVISLPVDDMAGNIVKPRGSFISMPAPPTSGVLPSFKSAGGKNIVLSDANLAKAKTMFDSVTKGCDQMPPEVIQEEQDDANFEFNDENRPRSPVISLPVDDIAGNIVKPRKSFISMPAPPSSGGLPSFKSAGGSNIVLSDANLARARTLFDSVTKGCDQMPSDVFQKEQDDVNFEFNDENRSRSPVINLCMDMAGNIVKPRESFTSMPAPPSSGSLPSFKSAGGSNIILSDVNLARARTLFDSVTKGCDQMPPTVLQEEQDDVYFEFNDQNRPTSPVINLRMDMARNIVKPKESFISMPAPPSSDQLLLPSFKSAGGKNIVLCDANVEKARAMFDSVTKGCEQTPPDVQEDQGDLKCKLNNEYRLGSLVIAGESSASIRTPPRGFRDVENCLSYRSPSPQKPLNRNFVAENNKSLNEESCDEKAVTERPLKGNAFALKEMCSPEWEEFPDLKSSQAALLEQSGSKMVNCASATNPSTPLSSRVQLNPVLGTKRKSLALLGAAAKKPKPSPLPQYPEVYFSPLVKSEVTRETLKARQMEIISSKKKKKITSVPGMLIQKKRTFSQLKLWNLCDQFKSRVSKEDVEAGNVESEFYGLTSGNASETAVNLRFRLTDSTKALNGALMADSCLLVYNTDGTAGLEEVATAFLTSPHVDPDLVPKGWVKNHYRWIVWKLVCYERRRFSQLFSKCLSLENVLLQLKYRYDREIDRAERSAFKKLLESDAAPTDFICCVASVKRNRLDEGESLLEFELTDGWYSIWAIIDQAMVGLYLEGKVGLGTKLMVHVAEITNCEQGCDPLNVPSNVKLKISTNSVRRARRFAKMGFMKRIDYIPTAIDEILPEGGVVGLLKAVVVRKYPVIYMCKDTNGKTVYRNERSQAAFQEQLEKRKNDYAEMHRERLTEEAEAMYIKPAKRTRRLTGREIQNIDDPEELCSILDAEDGDVLSMLSSDQTRLMSDYKNEIASKIGSYVQKELQGLMAEWDESNSKVTKLLKLRLMDCFSEKHVVLTIWRPNEDVSDTISENKAFKFINVVANATRDGVLQMSSTRQTNFECLSANALRTLQPPKAFERVVTPLSAIESQTPVFGELDTTGVVVLVKLPEQSSGNTVVYLSDLEGHYLSITFWTALSVFGCEDLITEGSLICCSNLQWRSSSSSQRKRIPSLFASEMTSFAKKPLQLMFGLASKDIHERISLAQTHVLQATKHIPFPGGGSPAVPVRSPAACTPVKSTPGGSTSAGRTPVSSVPSTSNSVGQRLKIVSRFAGDASPLPPMPLVVNTRHVFSKFKSPCATPNKVNSKS